MWETEQVSGSIVPPAAEEKGPGVTGVWSDLSSSVRFGRLATVDVVVSGGLERLQRAPPKPCPRQTTSSANAGVLAMTARSGQKGAGGPTPGVHMDGPASERGTPFAPAHRGRRVPVRTWGLEFGNRNLCCTYPFEVGIYLR